MPNEIADTGVSVENFQLFLSHVIKLDNVIKLDK